MLCWQTVYFLGKFSRLSKIPAGIFCTAVRAEAPTGPQLEPFRAVLNRAKVSIHDSP
jgi:hypothetical protein